MNDGAISDETMSDPTAQTPAGPDADAVGSWTVSLSEVDAMCRKAARGAGMSWGLAEEAGRAARALAALGQDGPGALLAAIDAMDGNVAAHMPHVGPPEWSSPADRLCPVATGAALSDRASTIAAGGSVRLGPVLSPLLLVPFLCMAARGVGASFRLVRGSHTSVATPAGPVVEDWGFLSVPILEGISVAAAAGSPGQAAKAAATGLEVSVDLWRRLDRYAHRTYAPATENSRRSGAGAGTRDTD